MVERFQPAGRPTLPLPLSPAVRAGDFVFVSGQIATLPDGSVYIGDFEREVELTIDNVELVLAAAGARLDQVVKVGAYLSNPLLFGPFNGVYQRRIGDAPPARTTVVVNFGHPDVRVEIDAVAYVGG